MSTSNVNNPVGTYPSGISLDPLSEPKPSTRQDVPPNQDPQIKALDDDPSQTSNPVKKGTSSVAQGTTTAVDREGEHSRREVTSSSEGGEKKGIGEKIKDKLKK